MPHEYLLQIQAKRSIPSPQTVDNKTLHSPTTKNHQGSEFIEVCMEQWLVGQGPVQGAFRAGSRQCSRGGWISLLHSLLKADTVLSIQPKPQGKG